METTVKNSIKSNIKQVIKSNDFSSITLEVGLLGTKLTYYSKKEFGERVLDQLERDNVRDIIFVGVQDNVLVFRTINEVPFTSNRGYGDGKYMGD